MDDLDDIKKLITDKEKSDSNSDMDDKYEKVFEDSTLDKHMNDKNPKDIPIPVPSVSKGKKTKKKIL